MIPEYIRKFLPFNQKQKMVEPNSIMDGTTEIIDKVKYIQNEFDVSLAFEASNLERNSDNWNLYRGYEGRSYPKEIKNKLEKEGRNPFEGNFIRQKVDGLAGSIIKNYYDVGFSPVNGEHSKLTEFITQLMYIDKELLDWDSSYRQLVIDGLIHLGVEEMYVDYRYSPFGNIGFRPVLPNHIILDPHWISNNAWDLKRAFKVAYLIPRQIKEIYQNKSDEIENWVKVKQGTATNYNNGDPNEGVAHYGMNPTYGDKYRVIEYHHMEKEKRSIEVVVASGMVVPEGTNDYKKEWAILNGIDLSMGVMKRDIELDIYYVSAIVPGLSTTIMLEDKPGLVQVGRLPFFPWSSGRINGTNSGIPDLLKSIQQTYNFRESQLDYTIATSAAGATAIDPNLVDGDEARMVEIERNWNKPSFRMWSAPGAIASGRQYFQEFPRNKMDYGIVNEITRMIEMADRISKQPAAMEGRSEGSEETGILYARKTIQAEVTQTILMKSLEQHWNDKGEAYLLAAKKHYSGVYREFYSPTSKNKIELNKPIITPSGETIENDISELPRMKVIVTQSPEGVNTRLVNRSINTELLRVLGPDHPIARAVAVKNILKTLDNNADEKAEYEAASELEMELAKENVVTQILNMKMNQAQIQSNMAGGGQQQGQPQQGGPQGNQPQQQQPQPAGNPQQTMPGNDRAMAAQQ